MPLYRLTFWSPITRISEGRRDKWYHDVATASGRRAAKLVPAFPFRTCADFVQEAAGVRNNHHRVLVALQVLLQPQDGVQVEVIRGLVEKQHVCRGTSPQSSAPRLWEQASEVAWGQPSVPGSMKRARASETRMRQPPENSCVARNVNVKTASAMPPTGAHTNVTPQRCYRTRIGFFIISGVKDSPERILAALIGASSASI